MGDNISPATPDIPDLPPDPTPVKRNTFQLMKDTWHGFSKKQKGQLIAVFALVLGLPTILGGVYSAKLIGSRASTLIRISPTPSQTPVPAIRCGVMCQTSKDCSAGLICYQQPKPSCAPGKACPLSITRGGVCKNPSCTTATNCICWTPSPKPTLKPTPTATPTPTLTPTPTPRTPTPTPTQNPISCSSVSVQGANYAGVMNGQATYYILSNVQATLTANTSPANILVNWKAAQCSSQLPDCGSFSVNNVSVTTYTAPTNTSGLNQGVDIRGDISEYPNPWLYCPTFTFIVYPISTPTPSPSSN